MGLVLSCICQQQLFFLTACDRLECIHGSYQELLPLFYLLLLGDLGCHHQVLWEIAYLWLHSRIACCNSYSLCWQTSIRGGEARPGPGQKCSETQT